MGDQENASWVNLAPAGSLTLAIATLGLFALHSGLVDKSGAVILGIWLIGGSIVHFIVGLVFVVKGANTQANAFVFFAAFLMLVSGTELIFRWAAGLHGWAIDSRINGYLWIPIWFAVWFWTPSVLKESPLVFIIAVVALDVAFPITSLMYLGVLDHGFGLVSSYALLVAAITTTYFGGASVLNYSYGRSVLPLGCPLIK
ncbi:hypothetical protein HMPREF0322_00146 [Desulfitobacterium hafniense DP7]|uniref:GPR1/FUN34/YaaH family protein n=1 Tax=Desulfitobacterium hafniense DP7 TaxID=537010 RepID=G9XGT0_DESHA|nr:hypothetical protein [Desulfitobacterium hafniense]EHL09115.1 hypothetical protein HMPREF0322_00146 [Desulfitobacterium hafniense DP7]